MQNDDASFNEEKRAFKQRLIDEGISARGVVGYRPQSDREKEICDALVADGFLEDMEDLYHFKQAW